MVVVVAVVLVVVMMLVVVLLTVAKIKGPAAQLLKLLKFASKPEEPGLSRSFRLEVVYIQTQTLMKSDS